MYKLMIGEDEEPIRRGLVYTIPWKKMDCCVVGEARNGMEGAQLIREKHPDIVLVDINMPVMDGLTMLRETRDCSYSAIILTGYSDFEYARQAIECRVTAYLLKPLCLEEIEDAVKRAKEARKIAEVYTSTLENRERLKEASPIRSYGKNGMETAVAAEMLAYIEQNYSRKILMQDLVSELHYSETFLNKRFKESTGITFNEYLNRYRIQRSLDLIAGGETNPSVLAECCGFGDYKYFNQVFRKYMGCSPREYAKAIQ